MHITKIRISVYIRRCKYHISSSCACLWFLAMPIMLQYAGNVQQFLQFWLDHMFNSLCSLPNSDVTINWTSEISDCAHMLDNWNQYLTSSNTSSLVKYILRGINNTKMHYPMHIEINTHSEALHSYIIQSA